MPTYEYVCEECNYSFEVFLKMSDEPVKTCPKCGKTVRQILSGGLGVNFRGSGFYANDVGNNTKSSGNKKQCSCCNPSSCSDC